MEIILSQQWEKLDAIHGRGRMSFLGNLIPISIHDPLKTATYLMDKTYE
ncbi:hypothetical protein BVRB_9g211220 [Beta vulgaris subsp. vulgaris]|nr:hypothetical protein BVRB_9g211220 [Beta vulgaris subsp. vulgaris]